MLFELYTKYLLNNGVEEEKIIGFVLDELPNAKYRNPIEWDQYIKSRITNKTKRHYVLIDEIQIDI